MISILGAEPASHCHIQPHAQRLNDDDDDDDDDVGDDDDGFYGEDDNNDPLKLTFYSVIFP